MHLEWFTHSINYDGVQILHIRPISGVDFLERQSIAVLDVEASRAMRDELQEAAANVACNFECDGQSILAHFYWKFRKLATEPTNPMQDIIHCNSRFARSANL